MRSLALSLALAASIAGPAGAETISAEIGRLGISATEARLAALPAPTPDELFALAGLRFLSGIEGALQLRWQTGVQADWTELPILRLPIPENPAARPLQAADLQTLIADLQADMEGARTALDALGSQDLALDVAMTDLWFDINLSGVRDEGEDLASVTGMALGGRIQSVDVIAPSIRFDTADAAWLSAYTHFLSAFASVAEAYDFPAALGRVQTAAAALDALQGTTPPSNALDMLFGRQVDRVAIILHAMASAPDPAAATRAHEHLLSMIRDNRRFWSLVEAETDNASEWVPNERQVSGLGIIMPPGTGERWQAVLADAEGVLTGTLLVPHWRLGVEAGIDVSLMFKNPPALDLVAMVQGEGFLPFARKGPVVSSQSWRDFERLVSGDAMLFAVFLN
jgi:hypothetical protein